MFGVEQDYMVGGQQPWLHGIVSGQGVVRQVRTLIFAPMSVLEHFSLSSLLRPALAQAIPLKNKLLARQRLVAFSLISFRVVQASTGSSSAIEKNSTVSFSLRRSDWWKVISSFSYGKSSGSLYHHFLLITLISSQEIRVGSKWSLVDYKRRVCPSATIQAAYGLEASCSYHMGYPFRRLQESPHSLGLAVGGQMYDAFNFRLFIVYFNPIIPDCRKYTAIRTPLGYGPAGISILGSPNSLAK